MQSTRWLSALALGLLLGCSDDCHDIGCGESLIVELAAEDGFADGTYEVTLVGGETTLACSFVMEGGSASMHSCSPELATLDSTELPRYVLVRYLQEQPATLSVTVVRDGEELMSGEITPEYEDVSVDPQRCAGPCRSAQVSVEF
jgi:hypothetical protein